MSNIQNIESTPPHISEFLKKNIIKIGGKPLLGHVIENVKKSKIFTNIIVSTEDNEISKIAMEHSLKIVPIRNKLLEYSKNQLIYGKKDFHHFNSLGYKLTSEKSLEEIY